MVIFLELVGFRKIVVRPRARIPHMRRNVNASYLKNRPNNRYGLIPYVGPIFSSAAAFMNQPPLSRESGHYNVAAYFANLATFVAFVVSVVCYEHGHTIAFVVSIAVVVILSMFDVIQDVAEAMSFWFGVPFFDNCSKVRYVPQKRLRKKGVAKVVHLKALAVREF